MTAGERPNAARRLTGAGPSPCIGVLIDCLDDSGYQSAILRGAIDTARASGAHLLCFAGGVIDGAPGEGRDRNFVFELARARNVDGLVVLAGSVGKRVGADSLGAFCHSLGAMPVCSVAVPIEGASSVCIDNESGMRTAIEHLVQVHGLRKIGFIRGPDSNDEAERRYRVYREVLAASGIPLQEDLVVLGTFEPASGRRAVDVLLDERRLPVASIQALVAANDSMALGAIEALDRRGVRVPDSVAVVGFDDVEEARFARPPLSTVHQPLFEQGRDAVRMVLDQLRSGVRSERVTRPTELVTRRSCGCLALGSQPSRRSADASSARLSFDAAIIRGRQVILAEMARAARGELASAGAGWNERLLNAFVEQVRGSRPDAFFRAYDDVLRKLETSQADLSICSAVLSSFRSAALRALADDCPERARAEDLFHEGLTLTTQVMDRLQAWRRIGAVRGARALGAALAAIASSRTRAELAGAVHAHLPDLGIARCVVLELSTDAAGARVANVALADPGDAPGAAGAERVDANVVLRDCVLQAEERAFAVLPMTADGERSAVVALELGAEDYAYESLRDVFNAVWARIE